MAPAMQPAEIQFAQRLASNEKGIRDRAVKKLRQYLSVKTQREAGGFSQEELLKIWKGLFYCMWMQDQPPLQEELANSISQLIHVVNNSEAQHLFIQTFWRTMNQEWKSIDGPRLDKYCMLTRLVLRQSLEALKRNGWEESQIQLFLDVLVKEILGPEGHSPEGVRTHFIAMYLDELSKVGGRELMADQNLKFIDPFCRVAAKTKDHTLVQTIARGVFEVIADQSPLAPEETLGEEKMEVGDAAPSEGELPADHTAVLRRCPSRKDGVCDQRESIDRGPSGDAGPPLQFDYGAVAERLLEMTKKKNTPPFNRKRLCRLIRKFQDLSEAGSESQLRVVEDASSADGEDQPFGPERHPSESHALPERVGLEEERGSRVPTGEEGGGGSVLKRKRKKNQQLQAAGPGPDGRSQGAEATASGGSDPLNGPSPSKRKRLKKKGLKAGREAWVSQSGPLGGPPQDLTPTGRARVLKRKQKLGALLVKGSGLVRLAWPARSPAEAALPEGDKPHKKKAGASSLNSDNLPTQKAAALKKRKKRKVSNVLGSEAEQCQALESIKAFSPAKTPLRMESDFVKFDSSFSPQPVFFRKAKSSTPTCSPHPTAQLTRTPSSSKKVTFGLNRNMTAEFRKTDKSLLVSPSGASRVAFDPEQRPLHGVLKTPSSSPAGTPRRRPRAMDFF
ncbi:ribosomal RNA processing protein 1 homolog B [Ochotona princeps]|uniref:ribosomal RNA processing protein 1 homolog B n=1 Tax=Ochotona princeps TaxID=9978 RepID=UPI002714E648|nr:ribosomal RNA processing protein 1 homolog B [Ochotona princeps]